LSNFSKTQEIELCVLSINVIEELLGWCKKFKWGGRVGVKWDTFREQVLVPNPEFRLWTEEEVKQILLDLNNQPDVTYAIEAPQKDST